MIHYLIILLDDTSTSYCHYGIPKDRDKKYIDIDVLKKAIRLAMMENMLIQFVYPKDELPSAYMEVINSVDHIDIKPFSIDKVVEGDVIVYNSLPIHHMVRRKSPPLIFRLTPCEFFDIPDILVKKICYATKRVNITLKFDDNYALDLERYKGKLQEISDIVEQEYKKGCSPQWNLLTDRIYLSEMNNCGAGDNTITLAPNGKFYICPAFYYDDMDDSVGDVLEGIDIPNQHLFKLENAPICRHCDAYHCRRCVWLNRKRTLEVNTPSHEQCVVSHLERNASQRLLYSIRAYDESMKRTEIIEIDYLDPFENRELW